ncbi:MAG: dephospho-CoA kinase, partial [Candidatus Eremiobacteraeota bacterium]|nr:dephospho-CoA kinase [Candidatus Eremiobacteraeota bacterium]
MIIGLTGGIGSGKTTVAALLAQKGAFVIDTDLVARDVVEPASPALAAIRREFGDSVINPDGSLDRAALARIIFHDEGKRAKLNELTHPEILKRVLALISSQPADTVIVAVVPLLFE